MSSTAIAELSLELSSEFNFIVCIPGYALKTSSHVILKIELNFALKLLSFICCTILKNDL